MMQSMETRDLQLLRSKANELENTIGQTAEEKDAFSVRCKRTLSNLVTLTTTEDIKRVIEILQVVIKCWNVLRSGPVVDKVDAIFEITASAALIFEVVRPYIRPLCDLLLLALSQFGKCDNIDIGKVAETVIVDTNVKHELPFEAVGIKEQFCISQAYLNGIQEHNQELKEHDVAVMTTCVPIYYGVKYMSILASEIKQGSDSRQLSKKDLIQACLKTLNDIEVYSQLAVLRDTILWQMYLLTIVTDHSQGVAAGIRSVINLNMKTDKEIVSFLVNPEPENVVLASLFNPSERPSTAKFLRNRNLAYPDLAFLEGHPRNIVLPSQPKLKAYVSAMPTNADHILLTSGECEGRDRFWFNRVKDNNFLICSKSRKCLYMPYVTAKMDIRCKALVDMNKETIWKVIKLANGKFVLSTQKWPDWFAIGYHTRSLHPVRLLRVDGHAGTCHRIPGQMAQWEIV